MRDKSESRVPPRINGGDRRSSRRRGGCLARLRRGIVLPYQAARVLQGVSGLKRYAVMPLLATLLVYGAAIVTMVWLLSSWDWTLSGAEWEFWGGFGGWLYRFVDRFLDVLKWIVGAPLLIVLCYFTFTSVGMVVGGPFNDLLSERLELAICGKQDRPVLSKWERVLGMLRASIDALKLLAMEMVCLVLVLPLLLIPVVGSVPLFMVMGYFSGVGFLDVAMSRNGFRNKLKREVFRRNRWELLGLGLAMEGLFLVPFFGLLFLPLGVVAGTMFYCFHDWDAYFRESRRELPAEFVYPRPRASRMENLV